MFKFFVGLTILYLCIQFCHGLNSTYMGRFKYSLQPAQQFEHQFFKMEGITSLDLFFDIPPYRKVEDQDLDCYWSFQDVGLQEVSNWQLQHYVDQQNGEQQKGDLLCLGEELCYLLSSPNMYVIDGKQLLQQPKLNKIIQFPSVRQEVQLLQLQDGQQQIIDLSSVGFLVVYDKQKFLIDIYDITYPFQPKRSNLKLPDALIAEIYKSKFVAANQLTNTLFVNTGEQIMVYTFEDFKRIRLLSVLKGDTITNTKEQLTTIGSNHLQFRFQEIVVQEDYLIVNSYVNGIQFYDVSEPNQIRKMIQTFNELDENAGFQPPNIRKVSTYQNYIAVLHSNEERKNLQVYLYQFTSDENDPNVVHLKLKLNGQVNIPLPSPEIDLQFQLISSEQAYILEGVSVTVISLTKHSYTNIHQKTRHSGQFNLTISQHYLPSLKNQVYTAFGKVFQMSNGNLKMFQTTNDSYNLVCQAPANLTEYNQVLNYLGVLRSKEPCINASHKLTTANQEYPALTEIVEREKNELRDETQCVYTFSLEMQIIKQQTRMNRKQTIFILIICAIVIAVLIQYVRTTCKTQMVTKTLQRFEELNNNKRSYPEQEKIRITHHLEQSDEENEIGSERQLQSNTQNVISILEENDFDNDGMIKLNIDQENENLI